MAAIYRRELKGYFNTMIGYVIIVFLLAFSGIYFMAYNLNYGYPYFSYVLSGGIFMLLIAAPLLTMRSFAEERKNRTDQLLLTAPVSLFQIVMGKYLAMITILGIPCAVYLLFPLMIKMQGTAYILSDYLSILVYFLLGCVYCNRNVRVIVDREPDYCGNRYLWYTNGYSIVEWNHRIPAFVSYG